MNGERAELDLDYMYMYVLQSTFPSLHYFTIISLMVTMLLVFLMETDRSLILFLKNSFQLRLTWGILWHGRNVH